jgi:hypothetical protein
MRLDLAEARGKSILLLAGERLAAKDEELVIEKRPVDAVARRVG